MLDVRLDRITVSRDGRVVLDRCDVTFPGSSHSALAGLSGSGKTTLLDVVRGSVTPADGAVIIGTRVSNRIKASARPVLSVGESATPGRKTIEYLLLTALQQRITDRADRLEELERLIREWDLEDVRRRSGRTLATSSLVRLACAEIEAFRPAVLLLQRFAAPLRASDARPLLMQLYRTLRVSRSTVISEPAHDVELGLVDRVVVVDQMRAERVVTSRDLYVAPSTASEAALAGTFTLVPVDVVNGKVISPAGVWDDPRAEGIRRGMAVFRPRDFQLAERGEENDLILTVEEASFVEGEWWITGLLTGSTMLTVALRTPTVMHKGKLLPLRLREGAFPLLPIEHAGVISIPTDVIPSMRDSR